MEAARAQVWGTDGPPYSRPGLGGAALGRPSSPRTWEKQAGGTLSLHPVSNAEARGCTGWDQALAASGTSTWQREVTGPQTVADGGPEAHTTWIQCRQTGSVVRRRGSCHTSVCLGPLVLPQTHTPLPRHTDAVKLKIHLPKQFIFLCNFNKKPKSQWFFLGLDKVILKFI